MSQSRAGVPNILWISCHDINPDLGCYTGVWPGAEYACTPNLDRLAAGGARYDNAFAVAPVCAPSRSAIITGMYPTSIGTMHMRSRAVPPPEVRCFPEYLREAGYYCTNNYFTDYQFPTPVTVFDEASPQAHWRNRPDPDQPFFADFHAMVAHESQIYVDDEVYARNTAMLTPEQRHDPDLAPLPPYYPDTPTMRQAWARYSDNVTAVDHWAGGLLDQLEADGLADDTLVVFWSDHGRGMPRAKRWPYEAGLHEPLLVRWPGKIMPGTSRTELVSLMDLGPTMLTAAGLPVPEHMHGRPLFDAHGTFAPEPRQYVFGHSDRMTSAADTMRTVRDTRFRYIRNHHPDRPYFQHQEYCEGFSTWRELRRMKFKEVLIHEVGGVSDLFTDAQRRFLADSKPVEELYDLAADPHEVDNLADNPAYADDLRRLRCAVEDWQQTFGDLGLIHEEELIERWRPGGVEQVTSPPELTFTDGQIVAGCPTPGASIAWTADPPPPSPQPEPSIADGTAALVGELPAERRDETLALVGMWWGAPPIDGRSWHLYSGPVAVEAGVPLWFRACRLGYGDSADVVIAL